MALAFLSSSLRSARDWGECALNLAFPWPDSLEHEPKPIGEPICKQCGDCFPALKGIQTEFVCAHCEEHKWRFQWARSAYRTTGQIREAILGFKYEEQFYRRSQLVNWLTEAFDQHAANHSWDALVPVPLYHRRRRERGFNQARELANGLGQTRQIPVSDCLYRYRETVSQAKLKRQARWENMIHAFRLKPGFDVAGQNLLLIDDVFTTGATANACAEALAKAGAGRLAVLTIARS